jgi:hypothetical protein
VSEFSFINFVIRSSNLCPVSFEIIMLFSSLILWNMFFNAGCGLFKAHTTITISVAPRDDIGGGWLFTYFWFD